MPELGITIRMIVSLLGLAIALQTVVLIVKNLRYFGVTDGMMAPGQRLRDRTRALAGPAQRRFGIAPRLFLDHRLQPLHQLGVELGNAFTAPAGAADTTWPTFPRLELPDSLADRLARKAAGTANQTYASVSQGLGLTGRRQAPGTFVQHGPDRTKLRFQLRQCVHFAAAYCKSQPMPVTT